jgi:hypothetical protein
MPRRIHLSKALTNPSFRMRREISVPFGLARTLSGYQTRREGITRLDPSIWFGDRGGPNCYFSGMSNKDPAEI